MTFEDEHDKFANEIGDENRAAEIQGQEMFAVAKLKWQRLKAEGFDCELWLKACQEYGRFFNDLGRGYFISPNDLTEIANIISYDE